MFLQGFYQRTNKSTDNITSYLKDIYDSNNQGEIREAVGAIQNELVVLENDIYSFLDALRTTFDFKDI